MSVNELCYSNNYSVILIVMTVFIIIWDFVHAYNKANNNCL